MSYYFCKIHKQSKHNDFTEIQIDVYKVETSVFNKFRKGKLESIFSFHE